MNAIGTPNLVLMVVAIINIALAFSIYSSNRHSIVNKSYTFSVIFAGFWSLGLAIFRLSTSVDLALLSAKLYYIFAALIAVFFLRFGYAFPNTEPKSNDLWGKPIIFLPLIPIAFFLFLTPWHIANINITGGVKDVTLGPAYAFYGLFFLSYMGLAFFRLFTKLKKSSGIEKIQLQFVFWGTVIATVGGSFFNLILPWFNNYQLIWAGPIATLIMVVLIAYAITKHHLFDIKVVATEIFSAILLILLFLNIFSSPNSTQYIINTALFLAAGLFSWLLIRSVLFEVNAREKISKLATALKLANKKLSQVDKVKTEFISIASHQLRTPLTIIKGYTSMALEGTFGRFSKEQHGVLDKLYQSANRLINLVEDLLNISRLEQGRIEYEYKVMDIVGLVKGVVEELQPKAEKKGLKLIFERPKDSVPRVRADEQKIRQVFINLIDNSVKYTEQGSVSVSLERQEDRVRFKVADTGIGIAKDDLSTLFKKFTRGSHVSQMYTEGVGLGLYFARKVVENHGGKLWAESAGEGKGSVFTVELPMAS